MAKRITFQFEDDLDYQMQAIHSTVELFRGLSRHVDGIYRPNRIRKVGEGDPVRNNDIVVGSRLLENLRKVQLSNDLFADNVLADGNNFTIEMETGTGKTYVYLRTILELYQEYGFRKFMIVVPSIAIRKGVEKSMEQLADHFKRLYNIDIGKHSFIYDSKNPKQISSKLVESNDLSICVLNIQAFNKDTNILRKTDEYEEYKKYVTTHTHELEMNKEYFPDYMNVQAVREGYFARDKKNNAVDVEGWDSSVDDSDVKLKAKSQEDIDRGISLILEKKDELISFEEPLAFIFSHSALREGWDNPNVFTLCTLKAGGSDIAKKQEIGRGLRLPVDNTGNRCIDRRINELTVIANDYYDHFASALQKDFNDNMHFVKDEVTADILIETLKSAGIPEEKISPKLVDTLKEELVSVGVMNTDNVLKGSSQQITKTLDNMVFVDDTLNEHAQLIKQQFKELMVQKGTRKIEITNGDNAPYDNGVRAYVTQGEFEKIYLGLRKNLMQRSIYKFKIDKDKFIDDCIFQINQSLLFKKAKNEYKVETGRAKFNTSQMFVMEELAYGDKELEVEITSDPKSDFEIANFIMYHTMLPRLAIFKILQGVTKRELLNNQDILDEVTQLIKGILNDTKASNITSYEVINGYELDERNIFELDTITEADFEQEWRVFKAKSDRSSAMNEYYKLDSEGESKFAHKLENNENVLLFTKLKKGGFVIDTPYGNYSPDWAVVCRKEALKDPSIGIYFIVETKAGKTWADLTDVEKNKIHCGELHFKAVSDDTKFDWVNGYEDFVNKFGVAESD